jgi:hypothetical protein
MVEIVGLKPRLRLSEPSMRPLTRPSDHSLVAEIRKTAEISSRFVRNSLVNRHGRATYYHPSGENLIHSNCGYIPV